MKKILMIGVGNMGAAMAHGLLDAHFISPENLFLCDPNSEKLEIFAQKGVNVSSDIAEYIETADIVIWAIKPQMMEEVFTQHRSSFHSDQIFLSIAAGVSITNIKKWSGVDNVVRIMPNTPIQVLQGICGVVFPSYFSPKNTQYITEMLAVFGGVIECQDEEQIDAITALSGSGPAYFFRILEIYAKNAQEFGFTEEQSKIIAINTLLGAGKLAEKSEDDFSTLREKVTSKGGTTAAALEKFKENNFEKVWKDSFIAAFERARELGK